MWNSIDSFINQLVCLKNKSIVSVKNKSAWVFITDNDDDDEYDDEEDDN